MDTLEDKIIEILTVSPSSGLLEHETARWILEVTAQTLHNNGLEMPDISGVVLAELELST